MHYAMQEQLRVPPPEFAEVIRTHFRSGWSVADIFLVVFL